MGDHLAVIPRTPGEVAKALLVIAVTLFTFVRGAVGDGFSPAEGLQFIVQALTLVAVYFVSGTLGKTIVAFILAGLQALAVPVSVVVGWTDWSAITFDDWAGAILAAFLAVGIAVVPNTPPMAQAELVQFDDPATNDLVAAIRENTEVTRKTL